MFRTLGLTFAAVVALGTVANAASTDTIREDVPVSYADLDLNTADGASTLLTRINDAAVQACGGMPYFQSMYSVAPDAVTHEFTKCRANAISEAVDTVSSPMLTRVYAQNGDAAQQLAGR